MKTLFLFCLSLLLINIPINAQEDNFYQNSLIPHPLNSIDSIDSHNGWAVGDNGTILKTSDNGTSWDLWSIGINNRLHSVDFLNKNDGFAVGDNVILKTTDGGWNWEVKYNDTLLFFSSVNFLTDSTIFVVGGEDIYNGIVLKSTDGGLSWINLTEMDMKGFFSSFFINPDSGYIAGEESIYRTINGGNSWEQNTNQNKRYYSLFFTDFLTGYVCGIIVGNLVGIIQKTTSGGNSWQNVHQTQGSCESIYFITTDTGYYVGLYVDPSYYSNPVTYKTTDVGELWNYLSNGAGALHDKWNAVYFTDPNIGFIVGNKGIANNGIILKTVDGGDSWNEVTSIQGIKSDVITISKYKLHQNYPNPFNPNTTIKYQIPEISFVTIKVYDVLGNKITSLVNEEKPAGSYEAKFDGSGLTSGIYFCQLRARNYIETKKMMLIK